MMTAEELREKLIEAISGNMYCEKAVDSILRIIREAVPKKYKHCTLHDTEWGYNRAIDEVIELLGGE